MKLSRRTLIAGAAAMALPMPAFAREADSLASLGAAKGIRFGSTVGKNNFADPRYRALNAAQCALVVPENEMKWAATRPDAEHFDFTGADRIVDWATANGMGVRGHTLLWHSEHWMPEWVSKHDYGANPKAEAERLLTQHVSTVAGRYAPRVDSFDVVNEAVDSETGELRETALSQRLGAIETLDIAFHTARQAAPKAQLVYNDYMGWRSDEGVHRDGVLRLLEEFRKRGTPVDALGVQSHLGSKYSDTPTGLGALDETAWRRFLDEVTGMGFDLLITEMDIHDNPLPGAIGPRDAEVAAHAKAYLDLMLSYRQIDTVMCWGLSDRYSWLNGLRPRPDGLPKRPCPYDADFRAKPFHDAIAAAFAAAPVRRKA
ncbi:endo-1,4-beta-xylanase [Novosphingobium sp. PhB165]|uniref:endo-1,4-beta-xylanase n=1 Tax=Novosphingobium sp. PhB165 TaxID=2485105 RepID=UPI001052D5AE|nr:endo-1,4-beta-xylanase [Novosphingobium sp. PhB165]TCM16105.1 endo-1,4-beta-xylanase [Novosphingobium sp. PhB165]